VELIPESSPPAKDSQAVRATLGRKTFHFDRDLIQRLADAESL
jgi:hypothetical protein